MSKDHKEASAVAAGMNKHRPGGEKAQRLGADQWGVEILSLIVAKPERKGVRSLVKTVLRPRFRK